MEDGAIFWTEFAFEVSLVVALDDKTGFGTGCLIESAANKAATFELAELY